jgi:hypothetical protein
MCDGACPRSERSPPPPLSKHARPAAAADRAVVATAAGSAHAPGDAAMVERAAEQRCAGPAGRASAAVTELAYSHSRRPRPRRP